MKFNIFSFDKIRKSMNSLITKIQIEICLFNFGQNLLSSFSYLQEANIDSEFISRSKYPF